MANSCNSALGVCEFDYSNELYIYLCQILFTPWATGYIRSVRLDVFQCILIFAALLC